MIICLESVLDEARLSAIGDLLSDSSLFEAGSTTAGATARSAKANLQGVRDNPAIVGLVEKIRHALDAHPVFRVAAIPKRIGRVLVSRYEPGMTYGTHYDEPWIDGLRTDLSFTLFLNSPEAYDGGELEIESPAGNQTVKLAAGSAVIYPSDSLHAVLPVTKGARLTVVGWIQSRVRSSEQRRLLFELANATSEAQQHMVKDAQAITALKHVRNNLLRMWSEG
ncbi:MAG: Fe2+-dependent dioxygenase [Pseudomonadota bacterium]